MAVVQKGPLKIRRGLDCVVKMAAKVWVEGHYQPNVSRTTETDAERRTNTLFFACMVVISCIEGYNTCILFIYACILIAARVNR